MQFHALKINDFTEYKNNEILHSILQFSLYRSFDQSGSTLQHAGFT